jgi:hypothetical protein
MLRYRLPDENLLVEQHVEHWAGPEYAQSKLKSVSPTGEVAWDVQLPLEPPVRIVTTARGYLVLPWRRRSAPQAAPSAGIIVLDPRTGDEVAASGDSIVDRDFLCTGSSSRPDCVASRAGAVARFEAWWQATSTTYGSAPHSEPYSVYDPDSNSTTRAVLTAWVPDQNGPSLLEVRLFTDAFGAGKREQYRLISFVGEAMKTQSGGRIYRRLGENRLLVSEALADTGFIGPNDWPWYNATEILAVIGEQPWKTVVGGKPALADSAGSDYSAGFMLADGALFWTAVSTRDGQTTQRRVIDLETGKERSEAPQRQLEGLCRP